MIQIIFIFGTRVIAKGLYPAVPREGEFLTFDPDNEEGTVEHYVVHDVTWQLSALEGLTVEVTLAKADSYDD